MSLSAAAANRSHASRDDGLPTGIVLLENSRSYGQLVAGAIRERLGLPVTVVSTLAEAGEVVDRHDNLFLALTGLVCSDGDADAIIDFFLDRGLPTVVVSGVYDDAVRERVAQRSIIDCVLKNTPGAIDYLVWLVRRLERNRRISALVVDDSASARGLAGALLGLYGLRVVEAASGMEGLAALATDPRIRLVITDHQMPGMDGIEFTRRIRALHARDRLAIIGVSGAGGNALVAHFLKNGANDFLHKPFSREEFFCRVAQNVDNLELIGTLQDLATRDFLTGLPNRRHFLERGTQLVAASSPEERRLVAIMLDIDHFKRVNDTWGHDAGDLALRAVAQAVADHARPGDLVARFGGEEFCMLSPDLTLEEACARMEALREQVAALKIPVAGEHISVTISIGLSPVPRPDLHAMLLDADRMLYTAKAAGRNRIEVMRS